MKYLTLAKFTYNNNFLSMIKIASLKGLYGRHCRLSICWEDVGACQVYGVDMIEVLTRHIELIRKMMLDA